MPKRLNSTWRIKTAIYVSLVFAVLPVFGFAQEQDAWIVDAFDATIYVREDATLLVEETISVDFFEEKHGIFRDIPVVYRDAYGQRLTTDIEVLSVLQDGSTAQVKTSTLGGYTSIRIGDPDTMIDGPHTYTLMYRVDRALQFFESYDELYWNVTGEKWPTDIVSSTAVVVLPEGASVKQHACYVGEAGSIDQSCGEALEDNVAAFAGNQFMTVAVAFNKGFVIAPTFSNRLEWFFRDNWIAVVPIFIMIGLFFAWWKLGKDPSMRTIVPEYAPPNGMWAAYAGLISRTHVNRRDLAAMMVQLAVKGYVRFEVDGKGLRRKTTLVKVKEPQELDDAHAKLYDVLFSGRDRVTVKQLKTQDTAKKIAMVKKALLQRVKEDGIFVKHSLRNRNVMFVFAGVLFYATFFLGAFFGIFTGVMFFLALVCSVIFAWLMPKKTLHGTEVARKVLGFKVFMHTAERYRSRWQEKENIFEKFLPYAVAFGDTSHWAKVFEGMDYASPDWYQSSALLATPDLLVKDVMMTAASFASATAPSSSGSSGGGSVGGGFGGGGGGSW